MKAGEAPLSKDSIACCRGNHRASSISFSSTLMSVDMATARQPIMRLEGIGQGWQETYWTGPTFTPLSSSTSLLTASSIVSPGSMNPARQENMPTGKIFFLPNKHWFPSGWITSMMTTGSENTHTDKQEKNCTYSISNKKKKKNYLYIYTPLFSQLIINKLVCKMSPLYKRVKIFKPLVLSDQNSKGSHFIIIEIED